MWLLDHNMPARLIRVLEEYGIKSQTTYFHGWHELKNGELAKVAVQHGYLCIITRDVNFAESASRALTLYPEFAVVLVRLQQGPNKVFIERFKAAWEKQVIQPEAGKCKTWPLPAH